jgi:ABC-type transport system involved in cytochrome bd biosynthesis fused ATPase/permease subunit
MKKLKQILLLAATGGQLLGIAMLFINMKAAIIFYILYALLILALFIVLIIERKKEKEEDERNDYRDY